MICGVQGSFEGPYAAVAAVVFRRHSPALRSEGEGMEGVGTSPVVGLDQENLI